jgi:hypothetical protein
MFVLRGAAERLFQVKGCACVGLQKLLFVRWCNSPELVSKHAIRWRLAVELDVLELDDFVVLREVPCWRFESADVVVSCF